MWAGQGFVNRAMDLFVFYIRGNIRYILVGCLADPKPTDVRETGHCLAPAIFVCFHYIFEGFVGHWWVAWLIPIQRMWKRQGIVFL